jgi:hypothetical protein
MVTLLNATITARIFLVSTTGVILAATEEKLV